MSQQERRMAEVDALALKYPKPLGEPGFGKIVAYWNPDGPPGYRAMAVVFISGTQMSICHADLPSIAQGKAEDYWRLSESWHAPKIDKRRTTDPQARLARTLDRLENAVDSMEGTSDGT